MHDRPRIGHIIRTILAWATAQPKIRAVALVGSYARGAARPESDIDLVLLVTDPQGFRADTTWIEQIDWQALDSHPQTWQDEDYGVAWSRRIWPAADSVQVELTFAPLSWAKVCCVWRLVQKRWNALSVGESIRIEWPPSRSPRQRRQR
jgi:hypothetical protein